MIRLVSAPYFCATKLDAFGDRGKGDYYHHDIEDLVAVVDGREELLKKCVRRPTRYARTSPRGRGRFCNRSRLLDALPGTARAIRPVGRRLPLVEGRLRAISRL